MFDQIPKRLAHLDPHAGSYTPLVDRNERKAKKSRRWEKTKNKVRISKRDERRKIQQYCSSYLVSLVTNLLRRVVLQRGSLGPFRLETQPNSSQQPNSQRRTDDSNRSRLTICVSSISSCSDFTLATLGVLTCLPNS